MRTLSRTPFPKWPGSLRRSPKSVLFSSGNEAISRSKQPPFGFLVDPDRRPFLDSARRPVLRPLGAALDPMTSVENEQAVGAVDANRLRKLQLAGILSGF